MAHILVVEDDVKIRSLLHQILTSGGYQVFLAGNVAQAQQHLRDKYIDLILLDWMLGKEDGMQILQHLRKDNSNRDIPIIMLTARSSVEDQVYGLDKGVQDYITKPFASAALLARIRSTLSQHPRSLRNVICVGDCKLDIDKAEFSYKGKQINLDPSDTRMLECLMRQAGLPMKRTKLLNALATTNQLVEHRTVDVHIYRLRKNLAQVCEHPLIVTKRALGYMFVKEDT